MTDTATERRPAPDRPALPGHDRQRHRRDRAGWPSRRTTRPGDTLVRQGDPGETLIVIVDGRATVDQDGTVIRRLANGDFLGEISLIDGGPRTATVIAETPIEALVIDRAGFDRLMGDHPAVRLGLLMALSERLRQRAPAVSD